MTGHHGCLACAISAHLRNGDVIKACAGEESSHHSRKHEGVVDGHRQLNVPKVAWTCHVALLAGGAPVHCSPVVNLNRSPVTSEF